MIKKYLEIEIVEGRTLIFNFDSKLNDDEISIYIKEDRDQNLILSIEEAHALKNILQTTITTSRGLI